MCPPYIKELALPDYSSSMDLLPYNTHPHNNIILEVCLPHYWQVLSLGCTPFTKSLYESYSRYSALILCTKMTALVLCRVSDHVSDRTPVCTVLLISMPCTYKVGSIDSKLLIKATSCIALANEQFIPPFWISINERAENKVTSKERCCQD